MTSVLFIALKTIELLLRSQTACLATRRYTATCRNRRSHRLRPRCVPQLEPRGEFPGASSHRCRRLPYVVAIEGAREWRPVMCVSLFNRVDGGDGGCRGRKGDRGSIKVGSPSYTRPRKADIDR